MKERWYLGSMNDGLFIIDTPPSPSYDDRWHERPDGPTLVLAAGDYDNRERAQAIVDAHNASVDRLTRAGVATGAALGLIG